RPAPSELTPVSVWGAPGRGLRHTAGFGRRRGRRAGRGLGCGSCGIRHGPGCGSCGSCDMARAAIRSEEHTSELQSRFELVCRRLLVKKNTDRKSTWMDTC